MPLHPYKLQEVVPLFTTALKRSQEEFENQLESIIRQKCTAIHPTVAWRFTEAAEKLLSNQRFFADATWKILSSMMFIHCMGK